MSQDVLLTVMNSMSLHNDSVNMEMQECEYGNAIDTIQSLRENTKEENVNHDKCDLEPINKELENSAAKLLSENERKEIVENVVHTPSVTTIAPGMFKLDLVPLPPRLLQNRDVHIDYLRHTQEQANTLRELVKQAKVKQPLDRELDFACKYATRIQELLVYVQDTCPNAITPSPKKVAITPMNKVKKVRFVEPLTSSSNIKQIGRIMGYGDYQLRNVVISRVYYVEGLGHNLFSIGQFCDADLELAKDGLARGIPRLKFQKDHLCSACALGKSKKSSHQPKAEETNQEKLYLLHMDLCGPMRVASINGKRYILVIVDDYSRFTWVRFLKTKDEAPAAIIKCIKNIQVRLNATVRNVRTDNGTEFVNQTLREWYENVGITHQTSVARTPQQNGVVERRNRTLVEAARTMLIFSKASLFLWAKAINTAYYT
ncbi:retrovirus-related pol polyprotein from transposon TNT 1-94 [Tanacetum coccineum]